MLTEDYCNFETAKLLKEKGFDEYCKSVYHVGSVCSVASLGYHDNEGYGAVIDEKQNSDFRKYDNAISAPTLQMAMKWLRETKDIQVVIYILNTIKKTWTFALFRNFSELTQKFYSFKTYEEACEEAIKYCLENLI